jgi:hypothetical protein
MRYIIIVCGTMLLCMPSLFSQSVTGDAELQTEISSLFGEEDAANAAERLAVLSDRPVDINSGDEEEISRLFFLTAFQIKILADYVKRHGNIVTIFEVAQLPGFDRPTAMLMEPYVFFSAPAISSSSKKGKTTVLLSAMITPPSSNADSTAVRSVLRINHSGKKLSYGLTAETDPWEDFTFHKAAGADFVSAHIMYNRKGTLSKLILGDYSLRFGEGLVFNNSSWQGSWLTSPSFMAGRDVINPYTSTDENNFFRGAGAVIGSLTAGATIFASSNAIDARLTYNSDSSKKFISNLVTGGLHYSESGKAARNALTENIFGVHLSGGSEKVRGGITLATTVFSIPFLPDTTNAENLYKFRGRHLINLGADIKAGTGKLFFYGEAAYSLPGSWAAVSGVRALPTERITLNLIGRYLAPGYHVFHSNIYGAGSTVANEMGLAGNIHIEAAKHLFVSAGADIYRFPWLRYRSSSPSVGARSELKVEYTPTDKLTLRGSWSIIQREYDTDDETGVSDTEVKRRLQASLLAAWSPLKNCTLTSRVVWCLVPETDEEGYLLCQDISYSLSKVRLWLRYSLFTTAGWDTRLYAYENDLLHSFSIPPLYGDGSRTYLMTEWNISSRIILRAKYAVTVRRADESQSVINEARIQIKILF